MENIFNNLKSYSIIFIVFLLVSLIFCLGFILTNYNIEGNIVEQNSDDNNTIDTTEKNNDRDSNGS